MRRTPLNLAIFASILTAQAGSVLAQTPPSPTVARPAPASGVTQPSDVIARSTPADWMPVPDEDLLIMEIAGQGSEAGGRAVIQLAPAFAPVHVANIRALARGGWWNEATIYRVQDNYVAQWGNNEAQRPLPRGIVQRPPAEYERPVRGLDIRPTGMVDTFADTGHVDGWPVAYEGANAWLPHCYGSVGVGRDNPPDTGMGGELYAVIGHAPRHLDRNIANVGRVIEGMSLLSARPRGTGDLGFYRAEAGERPIPIRRMVIAADLPAAERPQFEVMRTSSAAFAAYQRGRANRDGGFFIRPAGSVDICNTPVPVRRRAAR